MASSTCWCVHFRRQRRADGEEAGVDVRAKAAVHVDGKFRLHQRPVEPVAAVVGAAAEDAHALGAAQHRIQHDHREEVVVAGRRRMERLQEIGHRILAPHDDATLGALLRLVQGSAG
jgi:hypothetical protein